MSEPPPSGDAPGDTPVGSPAAAPASAKVLKKRGPKLKTGRFDTRKELVEAVWHDYEKTPRSQADIAQAYRVSQGVVASILSTPKPEPVGEPSAESPPSVPVEPKHAGRKPH